LPGADLTGLFIGAEGAYGIVTEVTLRTYAFPEEIYLERYIGSDLHDCVEIFQKIAFEQAHLLCLLPRHQRRLYTLRHQPRRV
jgi:FAD/FMN-containing dehydrogenase